MNWIEICTVCAVLVTNWQMRASGGTLRQLSVVVIYEYVYSQILMPQA